MKFPKSIFFWKFDPKLKFYENLTKILWQIDPNFFQKFDQKWKVYKKMTENQNLTRNQNFMKISPDLFWERENTCMSAF